MGDVSVSIVIDASPDDIWAAVEQIERHVDWMADADSITFDDDVRRGVGTGFTCVTRVGPIRLRDHMTVTGWEPSRRMAVQHNGIVAGVGEFAIEPINAISSRFRWDERLDFPWYFGGAVGARIVGGTVLRAVWRRNLVRLKRQLER